MSELPVCGLCGRALTGRGTVVIVGTNTPEEREVEFCADASGCRRATYERLGVLRVLHEYGEVASTEPIEVDISDYSDDFCVGFLAGQVNVIEAVGRRER